MPVKMVINDSFRKKVDGARLRMTLKQATTETMIELKDTLSVEPTPKKTGNLRRSNTYEVRLSSSTIEGLVRNHAPYWVYVNFGTSRIDPRNFVSQAVSKVRPAMKIKENFEKIYFGGG